MKLFNEINATLSQLKENDLSADRTKALSVIIEYITEKLANNESINLNFICTHNSRRSQFAQLWAKVASAYYGVPVNSYSGGVEVTEFNERAVATLRNQGFQIESSGITNPIYKVTFSSDAEPLAMYSKLYNDLSNPSENFAAIMTCSDTDDNCPVIMGTEQRIALLFDDPKEFDGTHQEQDKYTERSMQIASEMFHIFKQVIS